MPKIAFQRFGLPIFLVLIIALLSTNAVRAAENGAGFYLLGTKGPMAGVVPGPGLYFQNDVYYYNASTEKSKQLPVGGKIGVGLKAQALINLPTVIWSTPYHLFGGRLALGLTAPFGYQRINADFIAGPFEADNTDHIFTMGDPVLNTTLAWDRGPYHWNVNAMVNVPVGHYREHSMANVAFHRWGVDLSVAGTWYEPDIGWDISGVTGVTFNGKNNKTRYKTGTEWHIEGSISRDIGPPGTNAGLIGYHYQQISDDKGAGAVLGAFRGRTSALGLTAGHAFKIGNQPVQVRVKALREFNTKNRVKGTAVLFTLSLPLSK